MFRVFLAAALLFFAAQTTGILSFVAGDGCADQCADDGPDGRCPPACDCTCCPHLPALSAVIGEVSLITAVTTVRFAECPDQPRSIDPRDILHVPKRLLA